MADKPSHDRTLDVKGLLCPLPIVKLGKAMKERSEAGRAARNHGSLFDP